MNATSLIGMTILAVDAGKDLGSVDRLLISLEEKRLVGFVVTPPTNSMGGDPGRQTVLATEKVRSIGRDAITIPSEADLDVARDGELPAGTVAFGRAEMEAVITESGEEVGTVSSIEVNETDFQFQYLEVGQGFLSSSILVNKHDVISVGENAIIVRDSVLDVGAAQD